MRGLRLAVEGRLVSVSRWALLDLYHHHHHREKKNGLCYVEDRRAGGHVGGGDRIVRRARSAQQGGCARLGNLGDCMQIPALPFSSYSSSCDSCRFLREAPLYSLLGRHASVLRLSLHARLVGQQTLGRSHASGRPHADGRLVFLVIYLEVTKFDRWIFCR